MTEIRVTPLGAGQDVGRSCILVTIGGKNIMMDCGMHMGYNDDRRFPDFSYITKTDDEKLTDHLDCVIITHFHLDHCGALPYMSEMVGFDGPIYMTHPTKAICPILLEDYRKITVERKGETNFFTSEMIKQCMKKTVAVNLHEVIKVDDELEIKAYYAGHVLGAAMFQVRVGQQSMVYTGDYNMTPDRHLGAAWIDKCRPDLLITESTYATTIRDSKRCRERDFLKKVHSCVEKGGKVLIPVFALGRAQELCILLESYWERMNLKVPIYFSLGLTEKANHYYKLFITWTSQKIKKTFVHRNMFEFKHIKPFDRAYIENPGPMVVFATPGMLHAGLSLQVFKKWAPNPNNMIIMPGYCVAGTVGHKILNGAKRLEMENKQTLEVKLSVQYMSFSAHADAKGIMQLISWCEPKNVMLVHGEAEKMDFLKSKIQHQFGIDCFKPANGETAVIHTKHNIPVDVSLPLLKREASKLGSLPPDPKRPKIFHGALVMKGTKLQLIDPGLALKDLGLEEHNLRFTSTVMLDEEGQTTQTADRIYQLVKTNLKEFPVSYSSDGSISISDSVLVQVSGDEESKSVLVSWSHQVSICKVSSDGSISISDSVLVQVSGDEDSKSVLVSWSHQDEDVGSFLLKLLKEQLDT
ncbi:integrator complex subunit 11-like isoform X2 [Mytilus californianus]|uniref:integrator complex subunit 11-like isoform X2 n=1 Tax=Mytilus californianus TaxID=6549 RepID=UPI002247B374|nr:integrator complex subunit 11-like isoform X2 [Mytilus californianus]